MRCKIIIIFCGIAMTAFLSGCNSKKNEQENILASEQTNVFKGGDIGEINALLFSENNVQVADGISDEFETIVADSPSEDVGVLGEIFSLSIIEVSDINDDTITYDITAPDLSNFFIDCYEELLTVTEEAEFANILMEYTNSVDTKKTTVTLEYEYSRDNLLVDYKNKDFIDAMTGGLVTAYTNLYQEMIESYREALGE